MTLHRRHLLLGATTTTAALLLAGCAAGPRTRGALPPIVVVQGNGDTAALWQTTLWRFESTAGRASACTPSTCPTRSRATTTPSRSPGAAPPPSTWRT